MTNRKKIENKLRKDGVVDNFWCIENRITTRLGAVIHVLKEAGWQFYDDRSGFAPGTKNWRYYLKATPDGYSVPTYGTIPKKKTLVGELVVRPDGTRVYLMRPTEKAYGER